jgi:hypothetical protein
MVLLDLTPCCLVYKRYQSGDQSGDHILFDCKLLEHDRARLKAVVTRTEKWAVSGDKLSIKFYKYFKEFTNNIKLDKV